MKNIKKDFIRKTGRKAGNETQYLMSSEANKKSLDRSINDIEAGRGIKVSSKNIWK